MNNFSAVKIFKCFCYLVDDVANVNIFEYIFCNDVMEVSFYKLKDEIDIPVVISFDGFVQFDNVWVFQLTENLDFSISSLSIGGMLKGVEYFFQGVDLFGCFLFHFPNVSIGP